MEKKGPSQIVILFFRQREPYLFVEEGSKNFAINIFILQSHSLHTHTHTHTDTGKQNGQRSRVYNKKYCAVAVAANEYEYFIMNSEYNV